MADIFHRLFTETDSETYKFWNMLDNHVKCQKSLMILLNFYLYLSLVKLIFNIFLLSNVINHMEEICFGQYCL